MTQRTLDDWIILPFFLAVIVVCFCASMTFIGTGAAWMAHRTWGVLPALWFASGFWRAWWSCFAVADIVLVAVVLVFYYVGIFCSLVSEWRIRRWKR